MINRRTLLKIRDACCACSLATAFVLLISCGATLTSAVTPNVDLKSFNNIYVVKRDAETRGTSNLIVAELVRLGRQASSGPRSSMPSNVDAIVTYHDFWAWDVVWYLRDLLIQFRDPKTNVLLASLQSQRPSLGKTEPELMVKELLEPVMR